MCVLYTHILCKQKLLFWMQINRLTALFYIFLFHIIWLRKGLFTWFCLLCLSAMFSLFFFSPKSVFQFRAEEFWPCAAGPFCLRVTPIPMTTIWTVFGRSLCRREPESKWDKTLFLCLLKNTGLWLEEVRVIT